MIRVGGQYKFVFRWGDVVDFINEDNLEEFSVIEEARPVLPTYEFNFTLRKNKEFFLQHMNEGNLLEVSISTGREDSEEFTITLRPTKITFFQSGKDTIAVSSVGLLDAIPFLAKKRTGITSKVPSLFAIKDTASKYFRFETNINSTNDSQNWIQHSITDKEFIRHLWIHSNTPSFPIVGITIDGTFRFRDLKKAVSEGPVRTFSYSRTDNEILIEGPYSIKNNSGFLNSIGATGIQSYDGDVCNGTYTNSLSLPNTPLLANTHNFNSWIDWPYKQDIGQNEVINDFVHSSYWDSYRKNYASLLAYSSIMVELFSYNTLDDLRVTDIVSLKDNKIEDNSGSIPDYDGNYVITKIARKIEKKTIVNTYVLCRENQNIPIGELK